MDVKSVLQNTTHLKIAAIKEVLVTATGLEPRTT